MKVKKTKYQQLKDLIPETSETKDGARTHRGVHPTEWAMEINKLQQAGFK